MKKRMKILLTIFLSASMAVTPVTVMADDGQAQTQNTYEASVQETEVNTSSSGAETNEPETGTSLQKEEASDNQTPSAGAEEEIPASGGSSDSDEEQGTSGSGEPEEISTGVQSQNTENTDSNSEGIEHVKELIAALPDIKDVTADNEAQIKEAESAYNALSDADKTTLDDPTNIPAGKEQSYGRVLESALWGLEVLKKVDNSTTLPQGTYSASTTPDLTSSSSKGKSSSSRIRTWTVTEVTVDGQGKALATIQVDSGTYTTLRTNGETYQGTVSGTGKHKVTTFQNVPIDLNSTFYIAAYSSTMGTEIGYSVTTAIDESEATALNIKNNTGMFKAVNAKLEKQGDQTYLVMDLSGSGYHELYKGTYEEAVSNGDGSKDKGNDSWVHGYKNSEGRWEFAIPLTEGELNGTDIPLVAVSNTYYSKYLKGENDLKRAFYPRKIQVNESAKTLVTGDFTGETSLTVTLADGIMMKKPDAKLETVGGPNSNGYSETLKLIMQNGSYDRLYIGSKEDAAEAETKGETTRLDDANTFNVAVREGSFGGNITKDYLEKPVIVSFRGTSSGKWVERKVTISKIAKTLKIDPVTAQVRFRAVDEDGNAVPGVSFTVKRKDTQINPDSDSTYTLVKDTAYIVEASAEGFEAQTFNYTPDGTEAEHTVTLKKEKKEELKTVGLSYSAHVQNIGWQTNVTDGTEAGTVGRSLQMEAIKLSTTGDADVQAEYRSHIQNSGWENGWTKEGQISGTTGKKLRMEAVQIRLTGSDADKYDIWYQAHVQNYGWLGWTKNGASAGTTGKGLRMEAIRVRILPKGSAAPGSTDESYVEPLVCYQAHVQNKGWMSSASDGEIAGTTGEKLRMEAVKLTLNLPQSEGGIAYQSHLQNIGWEQSWKANGQISGTTGQKRRLEAVRIKLTGKIAEKYDIYYRVHVQNKGWTGWAKNGEDCGSTGLSLRGEALETVLVSKGASAPGSTANTCWR
jgi:uncharacterized protein YjdB